MVLTMHVANPVNCTAVRAWLSQEVPAWADVQIANHAEYLGIYVGPSAGCAQGKTYIETPLIK